MTSQKRWIRLFSFLAACLIPFGGMAEPTLTEKSLSLGGSRITYPAVTGMEDAEAEKAVNDAIVSGGHIADYLTRMSELISSGKITTEWFGGLYGDYLSIAFLAEGDVEDSRNTSVWTAVNLNLTTGQPFTWEELFAEPENAEEELIAYLEESAAPDLSPMLLNSRVTPVPETFRIDETGLIFLYPADQLCTLHDRAGDIHLAWCELQPLLNLDQGSPADRIGIPEALTLTAESVERIRTIAGGGCVPGIPVTIGESLQALTDRYHLVTDPDVYEGGRMFSLEGGCFRRVYLLTDFLSEDWENSVVQGIRMDRGNLSGLCIGSTSCEEWRMLLGEPDYTVVFDEQKAEINRTVPGECDYYACGAYQLRLQCSQDGVLYSIILTE